MRVRGRRWCRPPTWRRPCRGWLVDVLEVGGGAGAVGQDEGEGGAGALGGLGGVPRVGGGVGSGVVGQAAAAGGVGGGGGVDRPAAGSNTYTYVWKTSKASKGT